MRPSLRLRAPLQLRPRRLQGVRRHRQPRQQRQPRCPRLRLPRPNRLLPRRRQRLLLGAVAVLVVATPCPLILAVPVAIVSGLLRAARFGILIKGGEALEIAHRIDTVVFDKTGTLTMGRPEVVGIVAGGRDIAELLDLVASAERGSEHPLGAAIVARARRDELGFRPVTSFAAV